MNATSLYVSTSRLVFQADPEDSASWSDLYRLVPYLRQSLSCTVCGNLLIEPYTPTETNCQHHVCRSCKGGKKKLKPSCSWCKDYDKYVENVQLRILLQCYKKLCEYVSSSSIYRRLIVCKNAAPAGSSSLVDLIHEGSGFKDEFRSTSEDKSTFGVVQSVYTSTSTQTPAVPPDLPRSGTGDYSSGQTSNIKRLPVTPDVVNNVENNGNDSSIDGSTVYSVMYGGCGSKLTLKRSTGAEIKSEVVGHEIDVENIPIIEVSEKTVQNALRLQQQNARRRAARSSIKKLQSQQNSSVKGSNVSAKGNHSSSGAGSASSSGHHPPVKVGCRCGNATATPGKLTCCGQRCLCYIDSKPCLECKCRGCRNPHTPDGQKQIRPLIRDFHGYHMQMDSTDPNVVDCETYSSTSRLRHIPVGDTSEIPISIVPATSSATVQVVGMCTTQLRSVSSSATTPTSGIILDGNSIITTDNDGDELHLEI